MDGIKKDLPVLWEGLLYVSTHTNADHLPFRMCFLIRLIVFVIFISVAKVKGKSVLAKLIFCLRQEISVPMKAPLKIV